MLGCGWPVVCVLFCRASIFVVSCLSSLLLWVVV